MQMIGVLTKDLSGKALNWVVWSVERGGVAPIPQAGNGGKVPEYTTDWSLGGPLRDKYNITIEDFTHYCTATLRGKVYYGCVPRGKSALEAICRAVVDAMLGCQVKVPAVLISKDQASAA
ncbi:hypothetical protein [Geopseudomonas aromaticivorans]